MNSKNSAQESIRSTLEFRTPTVKDAGKIWELVRDCRPLDLNSPYLYLMLCLHFPKTCLVAENESGITGFVSAYHPPESPEILFIWQIAVDEKARGQGVAKQLLRELFNEKRRGEIKYLNFTISPTNKASMKLFQSWAQELELEMKEINVLSQNLFPAGNDHEEEVLYQIGPVY